MALTDLADACRKSGLKVVELPNWKTRGRPSGGFNPRGVLVHHTGGASNTREYVEWMAYTGRSDLPAPLCQLALDRQGVVYVCAGGRANHGGTARATGPMPSGDANYLYIGIEALNTGSEGWTTAQYDAYVRLCAALCSHYGWPAEHVRAHRETSVTGKWDPGLLDMTKFRVDIARALIDLEDDNMPDRSEFQQWVRETPITTRVGKKDEPKDRPLEKVLDDMEHHQEQDRKLLQEINGKLDKLLSGEQPGPELPKG